MKRLIILACLAACLIAAGSARASYWSVDTTITYDTTETTFKPAASSDDGYSSTSQVYYNLAYMLVRNTYSVRGPAFVRFPNVTVAQGGQITTAKWRQYGGAAIYDSISMYIHYEDTANAATLQSTDLDEITKRTVSEDSVYWESIDNNGSWEDSPSLVDLLETLFARVDWESGNAVALTCWYKADPVVCNWQFASYDGGDPTYYSQLVLGILSADTTYDSLLLGDYSMTWTGKDSIDDTHIISNLAAGDSASSGNVDHLFSFGDYGAADERHTLLRANDFASQFPYDSSYVVWAGWYLKVQSVNGPPETLYVKELFKPFVEGTGSETSCGANGASWHSWSCPSSDWTTPGANSADDEGEFNYGDGTGADRKDTPESYVTDPTLEQGAWVRLDATNYVKRCIAGAANDSAGVILNVSESGGWISFYSTNADADGPTYWPIFEITYDLPGEAAQKHAPFLKRE